MNKNLQQPPLSHFDKSFADNPWDVLFCSLNEVDRNLATKDLPEDREYLQNQLLDPRTKTTVLQPFYDHTIKARPEIFKCPHRSTLNKKEHVLCLGFLLAIHSKQKVYPHQLKCFEQTASRRQAEQVSFMNFLSQYNSANYEKIYAPHVMLSDLYQKLYHHEAQFLRNKHRDGIFQLQTGFPVPQKCGSSENLGSISDIVCISDSDELPSHTFANLDLSKMKPRIETYLDIHLNQEHVNEPEKLLDNKAQYSISLEALVFLLCSGEYIDTPCDMIVEVTEKGGEHVYHLNDVLPAKNMGPHTAELVANIATDVFLRTEINDNPPEIPAIAIKETYKLQTINDFMNNVAQQQRFPSTTRTYHHVDWTLNFENGNKQMRIVSRIDSFRRCTTKSSFKMEFKPQLGCEIISKAGLLREWLQLQLSRSPDSSLHRHRIDASTFKPILDENLHMTDLELELEKRYKVKISRLLGSLGDFLSLLNNVGPGRYLLRFNPRFTEKLMLCTEVKESTSKSSCSLHSLLQEPPSDLAFMTLRQLTPIDDTLCTAMHDFYKILPCAFPAGSGNSKTTRRVIDDRNFILKKAKAKIDKQLAKERKIKAKRNLVKRAKKTQRRKQKSKETKQQQTENTELEQEIKNDRILFGFD